jgi:hypothetical protein
VRPDSVRAFDGTARASEAIQRNIRRNPPPPEDGSQVAAMRREPPLQADALRGNPSVSSCDPSLRGGVAGLTA